MDPAKGTRLRGHDVCLSGLTAHFTPPLLRLIPLEHRPPAQEDPLHMMQVALHGFAGSGGKSGGAALP